MHTEKALLATRCLLVEDDDHLRSLLAQHLGEHVNELRSCGDAPRALALLREFSPALIVVDFKLEGGTALDILTEVEKLSPTPVVVVLSGEAAPDEAFELSERGVRRYLRKPITPERLVVALHAALATPPRLEARLRAAVGTLDLHTVEALARKTMIGEALAREDGSRRGAARLLGVSRQLLQHALRSLSD